jgi:hypothetical protein
MTVVTFVLCIEQNAIRPQALLLIDSIRTFAGRHRDASILAVAPRPGLGLGIDGETRARLDALGVTYVEEPLNHVCPEYGSANRVFTAAWAEQQARTEWLVVLDSDTIFLDEPQLPPDADVAVRPVDVKGSTTEGPGDPFEDYWTQLAALHGVTLDVLPFVQTFDRAHRVRASYNGGLIVVRRELGILRAWADLFARSVASGLRPWKGSNLNVHASTGYVGVAASEYWGSNQAALALAIWSRTQRVALLPDTYNLPLHMLRERPELMPPSTGSATAAAPVHVHYHWAFNAPFSESALETLRALGTSDDRHAWLRTRLPLPQPRLPPPTLAPPLPRKPAQRDPQGGRLDAAADDVGL